MARRRCCVKRRWKGRLHKKRERSALIFDGQWRKTERKKYVKLFIQERQPRRAHGSGACFIAENRREAHTVDAEHIKHLIATALPSERIDITGVRARFGQRGFPCSGSWWR